MQSDKKRASDLGKKARATAAVALVAKSAIPETAKPASPKPWKWTKAKRRAVELYCQGVKQTTIAEILGVDRKSLWRWVQHPEFAAACQRWASEQHRVRKGSRIHAIGLLSDAVRGLVSNQIQHLAEAQKTDKGATLGKDGIAQLGMLFRESRELMAQEREDFGDHAVRRVEGNFQHILAAPGMPTVTEEQRQEAGKVGEQSFAAYVRQHGDPALLKLRVGEQPAQALVAAGRAVAQDPALLQALFDAEEGEAK